MNVLNLFVCLLLFSLSGASQTQDLSSKKMTPMYVPTNVERYNLDYTLSDPDVLNGDLTLLNQLDLNLAESYRSQFEDVEYTDVNTGFVIVLYHEKKNNVVSPEILEK